MIKLSAAFLLVLLPGWLFAQLKGRVIDVATKQPLAFATIKSASTMTFTTENGKFNLAGIHFGDTVRVSSVGYKPYTFTVFNTTDTVTVYLELNSILLNDVHITGARNYKADSLALRQEYAKEFNYQKPKLKDFLKQPLPTYVHDDNGNKFDNSNTVGGLDLLSVVNFFGRNKTPTAKLQKELQQDEQDNYVDHAFSRSKVSRVTKLQGDSLRDFMMMYRPTVEQVKSMTDYDLILYIKSSYQQFLKLYDPKAEKDSIFKKE